MPALQPVAEPVPPAGLLRALPLDLLPMWNLALPQSTLPWVLL